MEESEPRAVLEALMRRRGDSYEGLSRLIGRNPAYIQQYVKRGSPRRLDEEDRRALARYFGVDDHILGGPGSAHVPSPGRASRRIIDRAKAMIMVPRLELGASAGAGSLDEDERAAGMVGFDPQWLRNLGVRPDKLSIIRVDGESMAKTLADGEEIMVDGGDAGDRLRDGIYVIRYDDALMVKRIVLGNPRDRVSIRSDNSQYRGWEDVPVRQIDIIGRVVWAGRQIG